MAIVGDVQLRVENTNVLRTKAGTVKTQINRMNQCLEELEARLEGTKGYWIGEAGDLHRRLYQEQKGDVAIMMKRLSEHPTDLIAIADVYDKTETENVEITNVLAVNAID